MMRRESLRARYWGRSITRTRTKLCLTSLCVLGCQALVVSPSVGQAAPSSAGPSSPMASPVDRAIDLAAKGRCEEALPSLKKLTSSVKVKELKYRALMATVRCSMKERDDRTTADTLFDMRIEFPQDPEVLYMTSQFFLGIAEGASQELT